MINIKKLLKGLRILNDVDQSKAVEITVDATATSNTKTTLVVKQTADRTIALPDVTGTLIANINNNANISGVTVNLTNTTENKLLVAGAITGNSLVQDSSITHVEDPTSVTLSVTKDLILSSPNKEVVIDGKAIRLPIVAFNPMTPPSGNAGDFLFNSTSQSVWLCDNSGFYLEQLSASGANRTLSNLLAPTSINQDLIPNGTKELGNISNKFNATLGAAAVDSLTVATTAIIMGNITADKVICNEVDILGSTTLINATTIDSLDPNVTLNKGGNNTTAQGSGLTIERVGTNGSLVYDSTLASRFKIGDLSVESEIMTVDTNQFISANKFFNGITSFGQTNANESGADVTISATRNLLILSNASLISIGKISYTAGINNVKGTIVNTLTTPVTLKHQINSGTTDGELYIPGATDYVLSPGTSVTFNSVTSGPIRIYYFECKVDASRVGMIESFGGDLNKVPEGYLLCDGNTVLKTDYPVLYSKIVDNWSKFNQTIAVGTFLLPDLRGSFLRGSSAIYNLSGFVIGSPSVLGNQSGAGWSKAKLGDRVYITGGGRTGYWFIDPITFGGSFMIFNTKSDALTGVSPVQFTSNGVISVTLDTDRNFGSRYGFNTTITDSTSNVGSEQIQQIQAHAHSIPLGTGSVVASSNVAPISSATPGGTATTSSTSGLETRPENKSVTYIIKAFPDYY
jgi:hypothetical protein